MDSDDEVECEFVPEKAPSITDTIHSMKQVGLPLLIDYNNAHPDDTHIFAMERRIMKYMEEREFAEKYKAENMTKTYNEVAAEVNKTYKTHVSANLVQYWLKHPLAEKKRKAENVIGAVENGLLRPFKRGLPKGLKCKLTIEVEVPLSQATELLKAVK